MPFCSSCGNYVLSTSASCPSCRWSPGYSQAAPRQQSVLIEHTAKHWKAIQAIGGLVMVLGIGLACLFMTVAYQSHVEQARRLAGPVVVSSAITVFGIAVYLVGRVGAWWNHG